MCRPLDFGALEGGGENTFQWQSRGGGGGNGSHFNPSNGRVSSVFYLKNEDGDQYLLKECMISICLCIFIN